MSFAVAMSEQTVVVPQNLVGRAIPGISCTAVHRLQHANDRHDRRRLRPRDRPERRDVRWPRPVTAAFAASYRESGLVLGLKAAIQGWNPVVSSGIMKQLTGRPAVRPLQLRLRK